MPRAVILTHVPFEGPAALLPWLQANGFQTDIIALYEPHTLPRADQFDWLVIMGGPMGANDEALHDWMPGEKALIRDAIAQQRTVLGICLGAQLIASVLGADVHPNPEREIGWFPVQPTLDCPSDIAHLFRDMPKVLHWHGDTFALPDGACHLLASEACANQAFLLGDRVLGLQCHLECDEATLAALCRACRNELIPGPWVQTEEELLAHAGHLAPLHQRLHALLALLPVGAARP